MKRILGIMLLILLSEELHAFHSVSTFLLNNRRYTESLDQPWLRIEAAEAADSSFGKLYVPESGDSSKPYWTAIENQTFSCMTRACVCAFFGGDNSTTTLHTPASMNSCKLPSGQPLQKAIRKEIRMLSDEERIRVETALNEMKRDGTYNRLSRVHKYSGVHSGPAFTIRVHHPQIPAPHTLGVPYWDTTLDSLLPEPKDSIMFFPIFLGTTDQEGHVVTGPYANWTTMEGLPWITRKIGSDPEGDFLTAARVDWIASHSDINKVLATTLPLTTCPDVDDLDERYLEYSHDYVHFYVSGDMGRSWSSSNDIVFLLHHSMIDHIFEMFREKGQTREQRERDYPRTDERCFPPWHNWDSHMPFMAPIRNIDEYSKTKSSRLSNGYTDNLYEFAPRPTCDDTSKGCGSKYLFCNVRPGEGPICMSKVRMGGICAGYEGTQICYMGVCQSGVCIPAPEPSKKTKIEKLPMSEKLKFPTLGHMIM